MRVKTWAGMGLLAIALLQAGCAVQPQVSQVTLKATFNEEEARNALRKGDSTIKGSALLRKAGGDVVTCAGSRVTLLPATEYAIERIRALYGTSFGGFRPTSAPRITFLPQTPDSFRTESRETVCDAQGYFKFADVAPGRYYLGVVISWMVGGGAYGPRREGGGIAKQVIVEPNSNLEVVLTE